MAFTDVWIEGYPVGTTPANELDTAISQGTRRALRERLAVDHVFEASEIDANIGAHKKVTLPVLAADPTSLEDGIIIYAKTVDSVGELFSITEADVVTQLTKGGKLNGASLVNMLTGIPTWDATVSYAQYVIIRLNGTLYVSLQASNLNKNPSTETAYWKALFGTKAGQALLLEEDDKLPALDGSLLTEVQRAGEIVQVVNYQTGAYASGTTTLPHDDTIPQNTEGDEYMTLSITPKSATNKLKIDVVVYGYSPTSYQHISALFKDSDADAIAVANTYDGGGVITNLKYSHFMTAGTTSEITFKVRCGSSNSAGYGFNGFYSAGRRFGGKLLSSITITEIKA